MRLVTRAARWSPIPARVIACTCSPIPSPRRSRSTPLRRGRAGAGERATTSSTSCRSCARRWRRAGLGFADLDAIAVTKGPGLVGALLVGVQVAKAWPMRTGLPLVGVHHLAGHLHAVFSASAGRAEAGRTGLSARRADRSAAGTPRCIRVIDPINVEQLSNTRDDAAGEAFDKVSRMLGLGYPGGPVVERLAKGGDPEAIRFTMPRFKSGLRRSISASAGSRRRC
jgi:tRNA A37 threonylcarbamoyltransferase TsaD